MALALTHNEPAPSTCDDSNDIILVSDLHLADGRTEPFGKFTQGENFFRDESFGRFLGKVSQSNHPQTLIINGDFVDFLRVNRVPRKEKPEDSLLVERWRRFLQAINHPTAGKDLYSADKSETEYGLKTDDYKSVWKLLLIHDGHKPFFDALRSFLANTGNTLIILKGNHDLEFFWEPVRQALVFFLAGENAQTYTAFNERIRFFQQSVVINGQLYVEHGHVYEDVTYSKRDTLPQYPDQLDLPVGSLFNRYVINKIEAIDPLFDNIKPPTSILRAVALHYPTKLLKIIFYHFLGAWKIVRKNHVRYAARIVGKIVSVGLPVLVFAGLAVLLYFKLQNLITDDVGRWLFNTVVSLVGALAVRWMQGLLSGSESSSLLEHAKAVYHGNPSLTIITFGHTHDSEMSLVAPDCWYVNSGTWIPTIEIGTNRVQDTNTFCVLRLINNNGTLQREPLLRWNDDRGELEQMIFFEVSSTK